MFVVQQLPSSVTSYTIHANALDKTLKSLCDTVDHNPDFQRGRVWTSEQQTRFIENLIRGVIGRRESLLVRFNCPDWNDPINPVETDLPINTLQCIDGLQRITAISEYFAGNILPFGVSCDVIEKSKHSLTRSRMSFSVHIYTIKTRRVLLQMYIDINTGGTVHTDEEILRVKKLLEEATL